MPWREAPDLPIAEDQGNRDDCDRAEVDSRRMAQQRAAGPNEPLGTIGEVGFEIGAPAADEVIAHVGRAISR